MKDHLFLSAAVRATKEAIAAMDSSQSFDEKRLLKPLKERRIASEM
jgi:hypothetical protein